MEESTEAQQRVQHTADRRVRELYRYYQPSSSPSDIPAPSWPQSGEDITSTSTADFADTPPAADGSGNSTSSATTRPLTAIGPEPLTLGVNNTTLTSFAQLAALRLNVERALICVLDRDMQYILAEATKTVNLNDNAIHDDKDHLWLGSAERQKAWSVSQVSVPIVYSLNLSQLPFSAKRSSLLISLTGYCRVVHVRSRICRV